MNRYDSERQADAAAMQAAAELVKSMTDDRVTRLRAQESPRQAAASGGPKDQVRTNAPETLMRACEGGFRATNVAAMAELVDLLRRVMFPGFFDPDPLWDGEVEPHMIRLCGRISRLLGEELGAAMRYGRRPPQHGGEKHVPIGISDAEYVSLAVREFMGALPQVRRMLALDVQAAFDGDPAAENTDEIILCYPGLEAIFVQRVAHVLYRLGVPVLPRVMGEQAHSRTGIDVHPGAIIGESFFIDHGSATVIGETSVIGKQVKIYQGVTLGARSFPKDERGRAIKGLKRHPTIGDRVTIYAGAVILGGDTVIGDDCVIAGGVFVTSSVPPGHVVQQTRPEPVLRPMGGKAAAQTKDVGGQLGWLEDGAGI